MLKTVISGPVSLIVGSSIVFSAVGDVLGTVDTIFLIGGILVLVEGQQLLSRAARSKAEKPGA